MANYATAALIRDTHEEFTDETKYPSATLTAAAEAWAEPLVDSRLTVAGFTMPITSVTNETLFKTLRMAASYLTGAHLLRKNARKMYGDGDGAAGVLQQVGIRILEDIASGKVDIGESRGTYGEAVIDATTDERPETQVIVSTDETVWTHLDETREG